MLLLLHSFTRTQSSSSLPECKWRTDALFRSSMGVAAGLLRQAIWPAYTYNCADLCLQRPSIKITLMMSERQKARSSGCTRVLFVQSGSSGKLQLVGWLTFLQPYFFVAKHSLIVAPDSQREQPVDWRAEAWKGAKLVSTGHWY